MFFLNRKQEFLLMENDSNRAGKRTISDSGRMTDSELSLSFFLPKYQV